LTQDRGTEGYVQIPGNEGTGKKIRTMSNTIVDQVIFSEVVHIANEYGTILSPLVAGETICIAGITATITGLSTIAMLSNGTVGIKDGSNTIGYVNIIGTIPITGASSATTLDLLKDGTVTITNPVNTVTISNPVNTVIISNPIGTVEISNPVNTITVYNPVNTITVSNPIGTVLVSNSYGTVQISNPIESISIIGTVPVSGNFAVNTIELLKAGTVTIFNPVNTVEVSNLYGTVLVSNTVSIAPISPFTIGNNSTVNFATGINATIVNNATVNLAANQSVLIGNNATIASITLPALTAGINTIGALTRVNTIDLVTSITNITGTMPSHAITNITGTIPAVSGSVNVLGTVSIVDIGTLPVPVVGTINLSAGNNTIGVVGITGGIGPVYHQISIAATSSSVITAGPTATKVIKVYSYVIVNNNDGLNTIQWFSNATPISGAMVLNTLSVNIISNVSPPGWLISTAVGETIRLSVSAACGGHFVYWDDDII